VSDLTESEGRQLDVCKSSGIAQQLIVNLSGLDSEVLRPL
jgi:hypothetical protein